MQSTRYGRPHNAPKAPSRKRPEPEAPPSLESLPYKHRNRLAAQTQSPRPIARAEALADLDTTEVYHEAHR
jgi:hypothetical protein